MTGSARTWTTATLLALLLGAILVPAAAQEVFEVSLEASELSRDGSTQLTLSLTGDDAPETLNAEDVTVTEGGEPIEDLTVERPAVTEGGVSATIMILFDISSSAAGEPIEAAKAAAIELAEDVVPAGVRIGLIPFATLSEVALEPTDDLDAIRAEIEGLEADGGTGLYDAIRLGAFTLQDVPGDRALVLFTDGSDTTSGATLDEALEAAAIVGLPIHNVALLTPEQEPPILDRIAAESNGLLLQVDQVGGLSDAFGTVAQALTNRFVISYLGTQVGTELDLDVTVEVDGVARSVGGVLLNPRVESAVEGAAPPPTANLFDAGPLGTETALYLGVGIAFVASALFLVLLFVPRSDRQASRTLRRSLTMTGRGGATAPPTGLSASAIGQRALDLISAAPKPEGYEDRLQVDLDRAGWQLRASEFIALRIASAFGTGALGWALTGAWWVGIVAGILGLYLPAIAMLNARQRRLNRFMEQLPDTLQLLSGTLKAGYGLLQAIDTIVKETRPPMSQEFQRVLTEARLGLPLEDSLDAMAMRIGSDDFRWVVVAMNIQRQVGGNLAELLETVSETLRGREQVRRQIQVLTAEGKLSAIILIALPFLLLFYLLLTNPAYLSPLLTSSVGLTMSAAGLMLIVAGVIWMSRMIKIDV